MDGPEIEMGEKHIRHEHNDSAQVNILQAIRI